VVAVFSILTKVGVYSIVRVGFMVDPSKPVLYGGSLLFAAAIATMAVGSLGALAARHPPRLIAFSVIVSAGTVLAALALGSASTLAPALFYLVISAPATAAAFLVAGMAARMQMHSVTAVLDRDGAEATYTAFDVGEPARSSASMDDDEVGFIIPAGVAFLGLAFLSCGLLVAGLPPLAGFLAKVSLIVAALGSLGVVQHPAHVWVLVVALLGASLAALLAFLRIGVRLFWTARETTRPRVRMLEAVPVAFLVLVGIGLTVMAGPVMTYLTAAARALHQPDAYIHAVLATSKPVQP
jgi:multicomponent K+:H+ antiporter subunit D